MVWEKRCAKELQSVSLRWVDKFICVSLHCAQVDVVERLVQGLALIRVADAAAIGLVIAPVWPEAHCALLGLLFGAAVARARRKLVAKHDPLDAIQSRHPPRDVGLPTRRDKTTNDPSRGVPLPCAGK